MRKWWVVIFLLPVFLFPSTEKLKIFMSFSIPLATWKDYALESENYDAVFVIRGIPNHSFPEFAEKLEEFRNRAIEISLEIDPEAFEQYAITMVPTIVRPTKHGFDKIAGNLSLDAACRLMDQ